MGHVSPSAIGESYHIYNRGAHKQKIFTTQADYKRFLLLLHLANNAEPMEMRDILKRYGGSTSVKTSVRIFTEEQVTNRLVDIYAYCLMPNHFHLVVRQRTDEGISKFMKKLGVGYTLYFNTKHEHSGVLFQGGFKSTHIADEAYFRYIFAYTHLNPLAIIDPGWEEKGIASAPHARRFLRGFAHSSYYDYCIGLRPERAIVAYDEAPDFLKEQNDLEEAIKWYQKSK